MAEKETLFFQVKDGGIYHREYGTRQSVTYAICGATRKTFFVNFVKEADLPPGARLCQHCEKMKGR